MIAEFGHYLLCLAAACSLFGAVAVWAGLVKGQQAAAGLWRVCTPVAALCLVVATGILLRAFLIDDFSIAYVADHSNTKLDVIYKAAALVGQPRRLHVAVDSSDGVGHLPSCVYSA